LKLLLLITPPKIIKAMSSSIIKMNNFGFYDPFRPRSKKQRQRDQIRQNFRKGRAGEDQVRMKYMMRGYEVERTGRGSDFRVRRRDPFTGRVNESKLVEVKTGGAELSGLQRKTKKKGNYKVERAAPWWY
jgi:hypothetical protein